MKGELKFVMTDNIAEMVFPEHLISSRAELAHICMQVCRELQSTLPDEDAHRYPHRHVVLKANKMTRLFFFTKKKYVSVALPLTFSFADRTPPQFSFNGCKIDSQSWSLLIESHTNLNAGCEDYADIYCNLASSTTDDTPDLVALFDTFLTTDFGYIRYDFDREGYDKAVAHNHPLRHPLHHCDIHLASHATFKTGLPDQITPAQFIEILDNEQDRWFLVPQKAALHHLS